VKEGKYAEAEPFYRRPLAILERTAGPDRTSVATSLDKYARVLLTLDRREEARILMARAQAIHQNKLAPRPNLTGR
jgi:tetratricopeptide repeat protein